jgi:hypothetical protein
MSWSDCPAAILPPVPLRLVGSFFGNDRTLPSSGASNSMTCRGLRPRRGADTLTGSACRTAGFRGNHPLARRDRKRSRGSIPSLPLRPIICFPSAQHNSLPPCTRSSVPARWLAFGQAGLSSLFAPASLGAQFTALGQPARHGGIRMPSRGIEPALSVAEQGNAGVRPERRSGAERYGGGYPGRCPPLIDMLPGHNARNSRLARGGRRTEPPHET